MESKTESKMDIKTDSKMDIKTDSKMYIQTDSKMDLKMDSSTTENEEVEEKDEASRVEIWKGVNDSMPGFELVSENEKRVNFLLFRYKT